MTTVAHNMTSLLRVNSSFKLMSRGRSATTACFAVGKARSWTASGGAQLMAIGAAALLLGTLRKKNTAQ